MLQEPLLKDTAAEWELWEFSPAQLMSDDLQEIDE
jgi:hypothetical protein